MSYADEYTDDKLKALESKVAKEYTKAYKQVKKQADDYFAAFNARYKAEYKAYQEGKYTDAEFKQWYLTQVARGKRYEQMVNDLAKRITGVNEIAAAYVNDETPTIYSLNRNYAAYQLEKMGVNATFGIYNEQAVRNLMMDKRNVTEFRTLRVNPVRDYNWNSEQIKSAVTSGIIRGVSIDKLADEFMVVMQRNRAAAIRNARTAVTSAQNAGRLDTMNAAEKQGVKVKKKWHSMEDARVRFTHALLNGQIRDKNKPFSNGLMFPGDSNGASAEVYNCRCRMEYVVAPYMAENSVENYDAWENMTPAEKDAEKAKYNAWVKEQEAKQAEYLRQVAQGKRPTWEVPADYDFGYNKKTNQQAPTTPAASTGLYNVADLITKTTKLGNTMSDDEHKEYMELVAKNDAIAKLYDNYADNINDITQQAGSGKFMPGANKIYYDYRTQSDINKYGTIAHEYGHFFDTLVGRDLERNEADTVNDKCSGMVKIEYIKQKASNSDLFLTAVRADKAALAANLTEVCKDIYYDDTTNGVQDFIDGCFGKQAHVRWHHGDKYYNRFYNTHIDSFFDKRDKYRDALKELGMGVSSHAKAKEYARIYDTASEAFANVTSAYTVGGKELEQVKKYMPNVCAAYEQIIGGK